MDTLFFDFSYHKWSDTSYTLYFTCPKCGKIQAEDVESLNKDITTTCLNFPLSCDVVFHISRDEMAGKRVDTNYMVELRKSL